MLLAMNPDHPEPRKIRLAVEALEAGEVIAYPTDTTYGLGCDLFNKKAIDRLYQIKRMDPKHQLAFVCPDLSDIARYAIVENQHYRILRRFLPGPYTFILQTTREVPKIVQSKKKTVGIRVPDHAIVIELTRALGRPIISTTAIFPKQEALVDPDEIREQFHGLGLVIDGGAGGIVPTTVIDLTALPPVVIRKGAGPTEDFE